MAASMFAGIANLFEVENLTVIQKEVLNWLARKKDVFLSIRTGGGKSLCYQAFPVVHKNVNGDEPCRVIIITPLLAIMKEQCQLLKNRGLTASYIGKNQHDDEEILNGNITFIFTSPEALLGIQKWRSMLLSSTDIKLLVVDEAHTVINWGVEESHGDTPFREWFGKVGEARSLLNCPILVITATASMSTRKQLRKKLALVNFEERVESPDRLNVKLFLVKVNTNTPLNDIFNWLITALRNEKSAFPRHIIFGMSIKTCGQLHTMFLTNLPPDVHCLVHMFHSCTPDPVKELIRKDMDDDNGKIRLLLATSAAGMGVNYKRVHDIIHFGPSTKMDSFLQELGRAGRDGLFSRHLLIFTKRQVASKKIDSDMKSYCENTEICRRDVILKCYESKAADDRVKHLCCDICAKSCACTSDDCKTKYEHCYAAPDMSDSEENEEEDLCDFFSTSSSTSSEKDSD